MASALLVDEVLTTSGETAHQGPSNFSEAFIASHLPRIFMQIYRRVQNVDDAQELAQEVFIKALTSRSGLRDWDRAAHWLSRIASNAAVDLLRKRRYRQTMAIDTVLNKADAAENNPEKAAILMDQHRRAKERLRNLTERERTALLLRDVEELPAAEVARLMGCSQATVRSHISNARIKLGTRAA